MTAKTYPYQDANWAARTMYRIHGCCFGKAINYHGTNDLADIIRLELEWKMDPEITSLSIYKDAKLIKEWRK